MRDDLSAEIAKVIADNSIIIHDHRDYGEMTATTLTPDTLADAIVAILAAHPDDSVTEWGVQRDVATPSTSREAAEYTIERQAKAPKGYRLHSVLVSRQVTPWQVNK